MKFPSMYRLALIATSLVFAGGVSTFSTQASAQEAQRKTVQTVSIAVRDDVRYISAYGIPRHAAQNYRELGIQPKSYAFKVDATPQAAGSKRVVGPDEIFGISLDGVPIKHPVVSYWNNSKSWGKLDTTLDQYGGTVIGDSYFYGGVPKGLISKDLTHVGYAADGFPIFVSRENKLETSYRLKSGNRDEARTSPQGAHNGDYLRDYQYVAQSGVLDECNGVKVRDKFYIYIITADAPHLPMCWTGTPDPTFLALTVQAPAREQGTEGLGVHQNMRQTTR